jgi:formylmethanofuran dehydrogenase subunit A
MNGMDAHFCHLQFMSYGGERGKAQRPAAEITANAVNENKNITIDDGQIIFGPAITMTSDGPVQYSLSRKTGGRWINDDLENESGGGIVPIEYKRSNPVHAAMWITGLELFLLLMTPAPLSYNRSPERRAISFIPLCYKAFDGQGFSGQRV